MSNPFQGWSVPDTEPHPFRGWTSPAHALNRRQADKERAAARRVQQWDQVGTFPLTTPDTGTAPVLGEGLIDLVFTYTFVQKPIFTYGHELAPNQAPISGSFPFVVACIHRWDTSTAGYQTLYLGATIGFVVSGSINQSSFLHYSFKGQAMMPITEFINDLGTL